MTGIIGGLVALAALVYVLKLAWIYLIGRRRPDWNQERAQFKKDLARSAKVAKWTFRHYWRE